MSENPQVWVNALVTLSVYSMLFKENQFQKIAEHIMVGMGVAHSIVVGFNNVEAMAWKPLTTRGEWWMAVPIILGLLLWTRWSKQWAYLSRASLGFLMGVGGAVALRGAVSADLFGQLLPILRLDPTVPSNWVMILGVFGTITQFLFVVTASRPGAPYGYGALGSTLRWVGTYLGQSTIMMALGAAYAFTIMGRVSVVIGRFNFLFRDWLYLIR